MPCFLKVLNDIIHKETFMQGNPGNGVSYLYESTSHLALAYIALYDLIRNSTKNISVCQIVVDIIYKAQVKKFIVIYLIWMVVPLVKHMLLAKLMIIK